MVHRIEEALTSQQIKVMIVDDHKIVRRGIKAFLAEFENICVIGEAANGIEAAAMVENIKPDVILLDLLMPGIDGIETIKRILAIQPNQRIIILTAFIHDDKLPLAIQAGAWGYIKKDAEPEDLLQSIQKVYAGEPAIDPGKAWKILRGMAGIETANPVEKKLTNREIEVLSLLTQGKTDHQIAELLFLTDVTVRTHVSRILMKLGLKNRVQAALYGLRTGVVNLEETRVLDEHLG